jgi:hypothetical protein
MKMYRLASLLTITIATEVDAEPQWLTVPPTPVLPNDDRSGYAPCKWNQISYAVFGITTPNGKNRTPSSKIPRSNLQRIQRMRHKRGGRKKCIRLISRRQKGRSNEVLRRRFGSRRPRQGLNIRFFPFGVGRPSVPGSPSTSPRLAVE